MIQRILLLVVLFFFVSSEDPRPEVKTPLGNVKGYFKTSFGGKTFSAFEGIPYAKPPIGERRFQKPEPIGLWTGTWDAIFVYECLQTTLIKQSSIQGEEDCLYVNVYVPKESPTSHDKLNVIVHIHGGAYMYGSGHSYATPEFLMDKNIIFVTFNYRLGIFGFLSTEDNIIPGNNGLKDQVLALKWVQNNIASFGGNPKSVTLTGLSAGGSSVHLHYLSEMSKGLFHRGFSQSGVALNPWSLQEGALSKAKILANAVGCPSYDNQLLIKCLKQRHYRQLILKTSVFFGYLATPVSPFGPVIEHGADSFLKKHPYELLANGVEVQDVPWMVSNVAHEGLLPAAFLFKDLENVDANWNTLAPYLLDYNYTLSEFKWEITAETVRKFYLGDKNIDKDSFMELIQLFSDRLFLADTELSLRLQAKVNKSPVYYYNFAYPGDHSPTETVSHADDAQYFFYNMFNRKDLTSNELKMKDFMLDMLVSFAKTGKPKVPDVEWEPIKEDTLKSLQINGYDVENKKMDVDLDSREHLAPILFWTSLGFEENENLFKDKEE